LYSTPIGRCFDKAVDQVALHPMVHFINIHALAFVASVPSHFGPFTAIADTNSQLSIMSKGMILRKGEKMGFKHLFDEDSSTHTYLIWDTNTKDAIIVDPVDIQIDRDLQEVEKLGLNLIYGVNTHCHADHITGTYLLKQRVEGLQSVISEASGAQADIHIYHGDRICFGHRYLEARATPGHTNGCMSYVADDMHFVLTGDALLIHGCGRTDFQGGSAELLYDSVYQQLFTLPRETLVYPGHDYMERTHSSIGAEMDNNPRLGEHKTKEEFVEIMANLNLAMPRKIDIAVPANLRCGVPDV